jgi:hypothetical protein
MYSFEKYLSLKNNLKKLSIVISTKIFSIVFTFTLQEINWHLNALFLPNMYFIDNVHSLWKLRALLG